MKSLDEFMKEILYLFNEQHLINISFQYWSDIVIIYDMNGVADLLGCVIIPGVKIKPYIHNDNIIYVDSDKIMQMNIYSRKKEILHTHDSDILNLLLYDSHVYFSGFSCHLYKYNIYDKICVYSDITIPSGALRLILFNGTILAARGNYTYCYISSKGVTF